MEQGAHGSCESDITGDTENPDEHSPLQPVVVDPVLRGGLWDRQWAEVPSRVNNAVILWMWKVLVFRRFLRFPFIISSFSTSPNA